MIYALYCKELPERTAALRDHMADRGLEPTYFRAAHGVTWGLETSKEYDKGHRLPPGHVALNVSSYFMWQHAYHTLFDDEIAIFFEDDVKLPEDFQAQFLQLGRDLERELPNWDLVFLGLAETSPAVWHKVTQRFGGPDSRLCQLTQPFGTHALMMRRRIIPILLDHMNAVERNLDQQLWNNVLKPGHIKNWCAVLPSLVTQRTFDYSGVSTPEWRASTLRPGEADAPKPPVASLQQVEADVRTQEYVDPLPCVYRGEWLDETGRVGGLRKPIPLAECARLGVICHTRSWSDVRDQLDEPVKQCATCELRKEMAPSTVRDRLLLPEGHFNPSIIKWGDRTILATRDSWGHSKVGLWDLTNDKPDWSGTWSCRPISSLASSDPQAPRLEDPRLFLHRRPQTGKPALHCSFSLPDGYPPKVVRVGYVRFSDDLQKIEDTVVFSSPNGCAYEKNWVPISDDNGLSWVYSTKPEHVIMGQIQNWVTPNNLPWTGGVVRGGAVPVMITRGEGLERMSPGTIRNITHPVYYHFFHGVIKRFTGNVYTIGCTVFDAKPPYRVLRQTPTPLIWPDLPAADESVIKRYVTWVGGAVAHAGAWHLALGIDDTFCRIVRIPFDDVERALSDVPEKRSPIGLRETPAARGVPESEVLR